METMSMARARKSVKNVIVLAVILLTVLAPAAPLYAAPKNTADQTNIATGARTGCSRNTCSFEELGALLPILQQDLQEGALKILQQYKIQDQIGAQDALDQVQAALAAKSNTPEWIAQGNSAAIAAASVMQKMQTLQLNQEFSATVLSEDAAARGDQASVDWYRDKRTNSINKSNANDARVGCSGPVESIFCTIVASVSALMVSVSAQLLSIVDSIFNWLIDNTIILFKTSIYDKAKDGLEIGWKTLRDIANIFIIGIFTFISISIILGLKGWGQKQLIANVLIVAVLINFSLLFSKIITDASNFTATQFYAAATDSKTITAAQTAAAARSSDNPSLPAAGTAPLVQRGIGDVFINFLGVTSIGSTYDAIRGAAKQSGGWVALAHGLLAATVLLSAAAVLLYGSFLLVSRAILLIFLMLTSALAFATFAIPKGTGTDWWSAWWGSLLRSAALAPLLIIFLWITSIIAGNIKPKEGVLGNLASGPASASDMGALFAYILILGLLLASFIAANKFSKKIGGFNWAQMLTALPLTLGSRAAGFAARIGIGKTAAIGAKALGTSAAAARRQLALATPNTPTYKNLQTKIDRLDRAKGIAGWFTKRDYNLMNTKAGKAAVKEIGLGSILGGALTGEKKVGGYEAIAKKKAAAAAERAEGAYALTGADQRRMQEDMARRREEQDRREMERLKEARELAAQQTQAAKEQARTNKESLQNQKIHQESIISGAQTQKDIISSAVKELEKRQIGGDKSDALAEAIADRKGQLNRQEEIIREARREISQIERRISEPDEHVAHSEKALREARDKEEEYPKKVATEIADAIKGAVEQSKSAATDASERYAMNVLSRALGRGQYQGRGGKGTYVGVRARDTFEDKYAKVKLKKNLETLMESMKESGVETPGAAAAPAAEGGAAPGAVGGTTT